MRKDIMHAPPRASGRVPAQRKLTVAPGRPMPAAPAAPVLTVVARYPDGTVPCPRCKDAMPAQRDGECFKCEHHDRSEAKRIARERAIAAYGEGRC